MSATTRPPRPGEIDGVHYWFVDRARFERMIAEGAFLEWAVFNDNYYGTLRDPVDRALAAGKDVLLEIDVQGARQIRRLRPDARMVFVAPPSLEELRRRLQGRGDTSPTEIDAKIEIARSEMAAAEELFDLVVVNSDLDQAVGEIVRYLTDPVA